MITIEVFYRIPGRFGSDVALDKTIEENAKFYNGEWFSSGSGDFVRQNSFDFESRSDALGFIRSLKPHKVEALITF